MNLKFKKSSLTISLLIAFIIHVIFILVCNFIYYNGNSDEKDNGVFLEFNEYEKKVITKKKENNIPKRIKPSINSGFTIESVISGPIKFSESETVVDTTGESYISVSDSIEYDSKLIDSLVVNYPSLLALKSVMSEYIKNTPKIETDSAMVVRRMRKYMLDYYKYKFPTPLSKFGDPTPGIAIDKIIEFINGNEDVDVKKIKKYLRINQ